MSLFKRGNVWWTYFYRDGIRYQRSTGARNRRNAEAIELKLKEEINNRRFQIVQTDPNMKFGELAARFIASTAVRPHHKHHLKLLLPFFAGVRIVNISPSLTEEFRRKRRSQSASGCMKDSTINRDVSVLRRVLYWGVEERLLLSNPLTRMKMPPERQVRRQVLSVTEETHLLEAAKDHMRAIIVAALDTGMRRGEITNQRWEDVDLNRKVLSVTKSKTPDGELREIPLTDRLYDFLSSCRQAEGVVFRFRGGPLQYIKTSWKSALRNAGVRDIRFHDLRHTFNTRLMEAGVLQEIRMAIMGHSAGSKVHARYTHIELPAKREAIRKLEQWVKEQQQKHVKEKNDASSKIE